MPDIHRRFNFNEGSGARENVQLVVCLDRSGSMEHCKTASEQSFAEFVEEQRRGPGRAWLTLYQFDDVFEVVYEGTDIQEVPPLALVPRNNTALYDAVVSTFTHTRARLASLEDEGIKTDGVMVVIITDGGENASTQATRQSANALITEARREGWGVVFLGASQDDLQEAQAMGVSKGSTAQYQPRVASSVRAAFASVGMTATSYRSGGSGEMEDVVGGTDFTSPNLTGPNTPLSSVLSWAQRTAAGAAQSPFAPTTGSSAWGTGGIAAYRNRGQSTGGDSE